MRGFLKPAVRPLITDSQITFRGLSRHRRSKLARAAQTNLIKADQWGRGDAVPSDVASALESALKAMQTKGNKKA